jgi:exopolyphosphatase/pppGpp-phosphohydrolase
VSGETGIRVRVISGQDEARLMARAFVRESRAGSFLICDLGGATTQWAWVEDGAIRALGSLPLGAIRNEYRFRELKDDPPEYLRIASRYCDDRLGDVPEVPSTSLLATGGTARAAGLWAGTSRISPEALGAFVARVAWDGAPPFLRPERAGVLLAGLVILESVLRRSRAEHLEVAVASVGEGLAQRLVKLVGSRSREDIHATLLLQTSDTGGISP